MPDFVRLRHPKTKATWNCPKRAVDAWLAKGWERAETESTSARRRGDNTQEKTNG